MLVIIVKRKTVELEKTLTKILSLPEIKIGIPEWAILDTAKDLTWEGLADPEKTQRVRHLSDRYLVLGEKVKEEIIWPEGVTPVVIPEFKEFMEDPKKKQEVWLQFKALATVRTRSFSSKDFPDTEREDLQKFQKRFKEQGGVLLIELPGKNLTVYADKCPGKSQYELTIDEFIILLETLIVLGAKNVTFTGR